jgi:hypothetical protein
MSVRLKRGIGLLILLCSLVLLTWGLWPLINETRSLVLPAGSLQLPTPTSMHLDFGWVL